jgi:hypothetical protein
LVVPGSADWTRLLPFRSRPGGALDATTPVASTEVNEVGLVTSADAGRCPPAGIETLRLLTQAGVVD